MPETKGNPASPAENGAMTSYVVRWPHFGHNSHIDLEEQMKTARNKTATLKIHVVPTQIIITKLTPLNTSTTINLASPAQPTSHPAVASG